MNQSHACYTKIQFPLFALPCTELLAHESPRSRATALPRRQLVLLGNLSYRTNPLVERGR